MGRVQITEENRSNESGDQFPRMKLDTNEKSRFILFEPPWSEWVHELKAPVIENGYGAKETKQRKDKTTYETWKMEFLRRSICLGDAGILKDKGIDEHNCPACAASLESGGNVARPIQRFAANVIRYDLRGGTWTVKNPFSATIEVWAFTARMWDELINLQNKIGDLRYHDLTLDCEDGHWQRNKLSFEMNPAWQEMGAGSYIKALLGDVANRATDDQLRDACGSVATRAYLQDDVNLILSRWRQIENAGSAGYAPPVTTSADELGAGLGGLLDTPGAGHSAAAQAGDDPLSVFTSPGQSLAGQQVAQQTASAYQAATGTPMTQPAADDDPFGVLSAGSPPQAAPAPAAAPVSPPPAPEPSHVPQHAAAPEDELGFEDLMKL